MLLGSTDSDFSPNHRRWVKIVAFSLVIIVFLLRGMKIITNPQFFAEDGSYFFAQAYNLGFFDSVFIRYAGYYHIVQRLIAEFALLFRLELVPAVFIFMATVIAILSCGLFLLDGFAWIIPNIYYRALFSLLLAALPANHEIMYHLVNIQWYLVIVSFLMVLIRIPKNLIWQISYVITWILLISSSAQAFIFIPALFVRGFVDRRGRVIAILTAIVTSVLIFFILSTAGESAAGQKVEINLDFISLMIGIVNVIAIRVLLASSLGIFSILNFINNGIGFYAYFWYIPFFMINLLFAVYLWRSKNYQNILLWIYILYTIAGSIGVVLVGRPLMLEQVQNINHIGGSDRYYILAIVALYFILLWIIFVAASAKQYWVLGLSLLMFIPSGYAVCRDFYLPEEPDTMWHLHAQRIQQADAIGLTTPVFIPINPVKIGWRMMILPQEVRVPILYYTPSEEVDNGNFDFAGDIDGKTQTLQIDDQLYIEGWFADDNIQMNSSEIYIINTVTREIIMRAYFNQAPIYEINMGDSVKSKQINWNYGIPAQQLGVGAHTLQAIIFESTTNKFYRIPGEHVVTISVDDL